MRGWEALERAGADVNVLCAVHAANQDHGAEVYQYFRDGLGARFLQFIPIVERVPAAALAQAEAGWRSGGAALLHRQEGDRVTSRSASPALAAMALLLRSGQPASDIMDPGTAALLGAALPAVEDSSAARATWRSPFPRSPRAFLRLNRTGVLVSADAGGDEDDEHYAEHNVEHGHDNR